MARLLALNVRLPREVTWKGKTVRTAIWKFPVEGRRMVRKVNVDGDAQADLAGHGGEQRRLKIPVSKKLPLKEARQGHTMAEKGTAGNRTISFGCSPYCSMGM
jgi:MOSC domain-containing protein YiiM